MALRTSATFEESMNKVEAVTEATREEMSRLEEVARQMGATTRYSATDAADALGYLGQAGFTVSEMADGLPGVLHMAAAANIDLAKAADIASGILRGFGIEAKNMDMVADVLAKTAARTNTSIEALGYAFSYAGPIAKMAGQSFEDTAATIGILANQGIDGERAGTALRGAITRLLRPPKMAREALNELGVSVETSGGQMRSLADIMIDLEKSGATTSQMLKIFGQEAGTGMVALLAQGGEAINALSSELDDSEGAAQKMAETMEQGLIGAIHELQSAWEELLISVGVEGGFLTMATNLVHGVTEIIQAFNGLDPAVIKIATRIGLVAVAAGPVLIVVGQLTTLVAAALNPIGLMVTGIIALAGAFTYLVGKYGSVQGMFAAFRDGAGDVVDGFLQGMRAGVSRLVDAGRAAFQSFVDGVKNLLGIHSPSSVAIEWGAMVVEGFFQGLMRGNLPGVSFGVFEEVIDGVRARIKELYEAIGNPARGDLSANWAALGATLGYGLRRGMETSVAAATEFFRTQIANIPANEDFTTGQYFMFGRVAIENFIEGMRGVDYRGYVDVFTKDFGQSVDESLQALPAETYQLGVDVREAFVEGFNRLKNTEFVTFARNMAKAVRQGLTKDLSPEVIAESIMAPDSMKSNVREMAFELRVWWDNTKIAPSIRQFGEDIWNAFAATDAGKGVRLVYHMLEGIRKGWKNVFDRGDLSFLDQMEEEIDPHDGEELGKRFGSLFRIGFESGVKGINPAAFDTGEENFFPSMIAMLGNIVGHIKGIGQDAIAGFWLGWNSNGARVGGDVVSWFDSLVARIRAALGIASPSKLLKEIGMWFMSGFVEGAESQTSAIYEATFGLFGRVVNEVKGVLDGLAPYAKSVLSLFTAQFVFYYNVIKFILEFLNVDVVAFEQEFRSTMSKVGEWLSDAAQEVRESASEFAAGFNAITQTIEDSMGRAVRGLLGDTIADALYDFLDRVNYGNVALVASFGVLLAFLGGPLLLTARGALTALGVIFGSGFGAMSTVVRTFVLLVDGSMRLLGIKTGISAVRINNQVGRMERAWYDFARSPSFPLLLVALNQFQAVFNRVFYEFELTGKRNSRLFRTNATGITGALLSIPFVRVFAVAIALIQSTAAGFLGFAASIALAAVLIRSDALPNIMEGFREARGEIKPFLQLLGEVIGGLGVAIREGFVPAMRELSNNGAVFQAIGKIAGELVNLFIDVGSALLTVGQNWKAANGDGASAFLKIGIGLTEVLNGVANAVGWVNEKLVQAIGWFNALPVYMQKTIVYIAGGVIALNLFTRAITSLAFWLVNFRKALAITFGGQLMKSLPFMFAMTEVFKEFAKILHLTGARLGLFQQYLVYTRRGTYLIAGDMTLLGKVMTVVGAIATGWPLVNALRDGLPQGAVVASNALRGLSARLQEFKLQVTAVDPVVYNFLGARFVGIVVAATDAIQGLLDGWANLMLGSNDPFMEFRQGLQSLGYEIAITFDGFLVTAQTALQGLSDYLATLPNEWGELGSLMAGALAQAIGSLRILTNLQGPDDVTFGAGFERIRATVVSALRDVSDAMLGFVAGFNAGFAEITGTAETSTSSIASLFGFLGETMGAFLSSIQDIIRGGENAAQAGQRWGTLFGTLRNSAADLMGVLPQIIQTIGLLVTGLARAIQWFANADPAIQKLVIGFAIAVKFVMLFGTALAAVGQTITITVGLIKLLWTVSKGVTTLAAFFGGLSATVALLSVALIAGAAALYFWYDAMSGGTAWQTLKNNLAKNLGIFEDYGSEALGSFLKGFVSKDSILSNIFGVTPADNQKAVEDGKEIAAGIASGMAQGINPAGLATGFAASVREALGLSVDQMDLSSPAAKLGKKWGDSFGEFLKTGWDIPILKMPDLDVEGWGRGISTRLQNFLTTEFTVPVPDLSDFGEKVIKAIADSITAQWDKLLQFIGWRSDQIKEKLNPANWFKSQTVSVDMELDINWVAADDAVTTELKDELTRIGTDAALGLVEGLSSQDEEVRKAAIGAAYEFIQTYREEMDMHSPSRVMKEAGEDTTQGLVDGLGEGAASVGAAAVGLVERFKRGLGFGKAGEEAGKEFGEGVELGVGKSASGSTAVENLELFREQLKQAEAEARRVAQQLEVMKRAFATATVFDMDLTGLDPKSLKLMEEQFKEGYRNLGEELPKELLEGFRNGTLEEKGQAAAKMNDFLQGWLPREQYEFDLDLKLNPTGDPYPGLVKSIEEGLTQGLANAQYSVNAAMANLSQGMLDTAKDTLGIASPSREMMLVGEQTGEGFRVGMANTTRDVRDAGAKMGGAAVDGAKQEVASQGKGLGAAMSDALDAASGAWDNFVRDFTGRSKPLKLDIDDGSFSGSLVRMEAKEQELEDRRKARTAARVQREEEANNNITSLSADYVTTLANAEILKVQQAQEANDLTYEQVEVLYGKLTEKYGGYQAAREAIDLAIQEAHNRRDGQYVERFNRTTDELIAIAWKRFDVEREISQGQLDLFTAQYEYAILTGDLTIQDRIDMLKAIRNQEGLSAQDIIGIDTMLFNLRKDRDEEFTNAAEENARRREEAARKELEAIQNLVQKGKYEIQFGYSNPQDIIAQLRPVEAELQATADAMAAAGQTGTEEFGNIAQQLSTVQSGIAELNTAIQDNWLNKLSLQAKYGVRDLAEINKELDKVITRVRGEISGMTGMAFSSQADIDRLNELNALLERLMETQDQLSTEGNANERARFEYLKATGQLTNDQVRADILKRLAIETEGTEGYYAVLTELYEFDSERRTAMVEGWRNAWENMKTFAENFKASLDATLNFNMEMAQGNSTFNSQQEIAGLDQIISKEQEVADAARQRLSDTENLTALTWGSIVGQIDAANQNIIQSIKDRNKVADTGYARERLFILNQMALAVGNVDRQRELRKQLQQLDQQYTVDSAARAQELAAAQTQADNDRVAAARANTARLASDAEERVAAQEANEERIRSRDTARYEFLKSINRITIEEERNHLSQQLANVNVLGAEWFNILGQISALDRQTWEESAENQRNAFTQQDGGIVGFSKRYKQVLQDQVREAKELYGKDSQQFKDAVYRKREYVKQYTEYEEQQEEDLLRERLENGEISLEEWEAYWRERKRLAEEGTADEAEAEEELEKIRKQKAAAPYSDAGKAVGSITEAMGQIGNLIGGDELGAYLSNLTSNVSNAFDQIAADIEKTGKVGANALAAIGQAITSIIGPAYKAWANAQAEVMKNRLREQGYSEEALQGLDAEANSIDGLMQAFEGIISMNPFQILAGFVNYLTAALGDMSNGTQQVREHFEEATDGMSMFSAEMVEGVARVQGAVGRVSRGGWLGLFGGTKEAIVDTEMVDRITQMFADIESTIMNGFKQAATSMARGEMTQAQFEQALKDAVYDAIVNAITEAVLGAATVAEALGPLITEYVNALLSGDYEKAGEVLTQINAEVESIAGQLGPALLQLGRQAGSAFGQGIEDGFSGAMPQFETPNMPWMDSTYQSNNPGAQNFWNAQSGARQAAFNASQQARADAHQARQQAASQAFQDRQQAASRAFQKSQQRASQAFQDRQRAQADAFQDKQEKEQERFAKRQEQERERFQEKQEAARERFEAGQEKQRERWDAEAEKRQERFDEKAQRREEAYDEVKRRRDRDWELKTRKWEREYEEEKQARQDAFNEEQREKEEAFNEEQRALDEAKQKEFEDRQKAIDAQVEMEFAQDALERETLELDYAKELAKAARKEQLEADLRADEMAWEDQKRAAEEAFNLEQEAREKAHNLAERKLDDAREELSYQRDTAHQAAERALDDAHELKERTIQKAFDDAERAIDKANSKLERDQEKAFSNQQKAEEKAFSEAQRAAEKRFSDAQEAKSKAFQRSQELAARRFQEAQENASYRFQQKQEAQSRAFQKGQEAADRKFQKEQEAREAWFNAEERRKEAEFWRKIWIEQAKQMGYVQDVMTGEWVEKPVGVMYPVPSAPSAPTPGMAYLPLDPGAPSAPSAFSPSSLGGTMAGSPRMPTPVGGGMDRGGTTNNTSNTFNINATVRNDADIDRISIAIADRVRRANRGI